MITEFCRANGLAIEDMMPEGPNPLLGEKHGHCHRCLRLLRVRRARERRGRARGARCLVTGAQWTRATRNGDIREGCGAKHLAAKVDMAGLAGASGATTAARQTVLQRDTIQERY